jgi:two-component system, chemotaxis family, sensor kinase CheA
VNRPPPALDRSRYAELFLAESREHISSINHALLEVERGGATAALVGELFRSVHTIKGMSATMGYAAVADLSHAMETLLERIRAGHRPASVEVTEALFRAVDGLERTIEALVEGKEERSPELDGAISRLQALSGITPPAGHPVIRPASGAAGRTSREDESSGAESKAASQSTKKPVRGAKTGAGKSATGKSATGKSATGKSATGKKAAAVREADPEEKSIGAIRSDVTAAPPSERTAGSCTVRFTIASDAPLPGVRAIVALERLKKIATVVSSTPPVEQFDSVPFLREVVVELSHAPDDAEIEGAVRGAGDIETVSIERGNDGAATPDVSSPEAVAAALVDSAGVSSGTGPRQRHVRVALERLDGLMNLIGELVIARGRLNVIAGNANVPALTETMTQVNRLTADLQEEIMSSRMVPVWQVFDRFPRLVRDAAHAVGKQVDFRIEGKEIELDRSMLDEIGDPIVHLLRNAVDHGIEPPAERVAAGKPPQGKLVLSASRERSAMLVRVSDDGRGIDRARVLARAHELGLVEAGRTALTDEELTRLVSRSGFSTAEKVTALSGRGVGVDAVQTRARLLGGSVDIRSASGAGTTVTLRLPLTLAIVRALLARVDQEIYAIPLTHIRETLELTAEAMRTVRGREVLVVREEVLPLVRLRERIGMPGAPGEERQVVIIEIGDRQAGLVVDELVGQQEIVVKQFDGVPDSHAMFGGATILGDGSPALILDVGNLL